MHIWIGVENFVKIETAKICVDNYTVLVGPNNSGKTFLMQLVQGVNKKLSSLIDKTLINILSVKGTEEYKEYVLSSENVGELIEHINTKLAIEKENIVKEIFGKEIPIEKLYVDIMMEEGTEYSIVMLDVAQENFINTVKKITDKFESIVVELVNRVNRGLVCLVLKKSQDGKVKKTLSVHGSFIEDKVKLFKLAFGSIFDQESLFLPASRTGLLLLYREFFANKTDNELSFTVMDNGVVESKENFASLTKPIYEFLRFLQTYSEQEEERKRYSEELTFFEEHLIEGHINVDKQGVFSYSVKDENDRVPMYLASSMINEVAPLVLAITSQNRYERLIIDEVEASLHPQKQLELVRFLNRLNNKGMQLIVSTHSDTFVSKLNNLYVLSEMVKTNGYDILEQFSLEKEDLVSPEKLFVYEFVNQPNGKSIVKEIKADKKMGYQFDLFTASALHLYEEATKLGEYNK